MSQAAQHRQSTRSTPAPNQSQWLHRPEVQRGMKGLLGLLLAITNYLETVLTQSGTRQNAWRSSGRPASRPTTTPRPSASSHHPSTGQSGGTSSQSPNETRHHNTTTSTRRNGMGSCTDASWRQKRTSNNSPPPSYP